MARPQTIPYDLLMNLRGETPTVIAGFVNVVTFWIDRGNMEPLPEERIRRLTLLPRNVWHLSGKAILEHLNAFYGPFTEHWKRTKCVSDTYSRNAVMARKKHALKKRLMKTEVGLTDVNEMSEFSMRPVKLERIHTPRIGDPVKHTTKPIDFTPTMRDE